VRVSKAHICTVHCSFKCEARGSRCGEGIAPYEGVHMKDFLPVRKHPRLKGYDYKQNGAYFITICVKDRHDMLGGIVGRDVLIAPEDKIAQQSDVPNTQPSSNVQLSEIGEIVDRHINRINSLNDIVSVDKYVVMPNHIHMILTLKHSISQNVEQQGGAMRTSRPTSLSIPNILRSFKTVVTKEIGISLWQTSFHDHIIRDEEEYLRIWKYIDENPIRWNEDEYNTKAP